MFQQFRPALDSFGRPAVLRRTVPTVYAPDRTPGEPFPSGMRVYILSTNGHGGHVVTDWRGRCATVNAGDVVYLYPATVAS